MEKNGKIEYIDREKQAMYLEKLFYSIENNVENLSPKELSNAVSKIDLNLILDFSKSENFKKLLETAKSLKIKNDYNNAEEDLAKFTTTSVYNILLKHIKILRENTDNKIFTKDISHSIRVLKLLFEFSHRVKNTAHLYK